MKTAVTRRGPLEIVLERVLEAPREIVFSAWATPEHLARWWGPDGFTLPACELDFRTGGSFRLRMRGPDGVEFPYEGRYEEVSPPLRIVMVGTVHDQTATRTVITFVERGGRTTLTVHQTFTVESDSTRGSDVGWSQSLERLAAVVEPSEGRG